MNCWTLLLAVCSGFISTTLCAGSEVLKVCENKKGNITCAGEIHVISAKYGRFDNVTCPHQSISSVNCSNDVLADIKSKCEAKQTCTLSPSNGEDIDPCPQTYKYLEVQFNCSPEETTPDSTTTTLSEMTTITTTTEQATDSDTTAVFLPPTTDPSSTTASSVKTNATCTCLCRYANDTSCKDGDLLCALAKLKKELTIDKTTLSSFKRTKISQYDDRTSATVIGLSGVAIITTILAIIVIPDFISVLKFFIVKFNQKKKNVVLPK